MTSAPASPALLLLTWGTDVDCAVHPDALACRLQHTLHWLQVLALLLGLLLVVALVLAGIAVRRNLRKDLTPP